LSTLQLGDRATSDELITTINRLNIVLKDRNFERMDAIFRQLDVTKISPEMMLAFIRTTFAARSKLGEWRQLRERVRAELSSRRFDSDTLLTDPPWQFGFTHFCIQRGGATHIII
jgi:hypothetical protein